MKCARAALATVLLVAVANVHRAGADEHDHKVSDNYWHCQQEPLAETVGLNWCKRITLWLPDLYLIKAQQFSL